jgi:hypothetical protein
VDLHQKDEQRKAKEDRLYGVRSQHVCALLHCLCIVVGRG